MKNESILLISLLMTRQKRITSTCKELELVIRNLELFVISHEPVGDHHSIVPFASRYLKKYKAERLKKLFT